MQRVGSVDEYLKRHPEWAVALGKLRKLMLSMELVECVKWGAPCYTLAGKHVVGMVAFREHLALWFPQGSLLSDPEGVLINAQEGTTKAQRQWRFHAAKEIRTSQIKPYVLEAIENQKRGKVRKPERDKPLVLPGELKAALAKNAAAKAAFAQLTKGKQREFADHIAAAKREATRLSRLEKALPMILAGIGWNDKYRRR